MKKPRTPAANGTSRLDVASPGVNFLLKSDTAVLIMTGPPTDAIHGVNRLMRTSCPLSPCLSALFKKISTPSDKHLRHGIAYAGSSAFWKAFKKPVAPAGYKNKQCRKQTSVLSGRIVTAYVPLRSATERERAAFLIPCQGLRGLDTIFFANSQFTAFQVPIATHR